MKCVLTGIADSGSSTVSNAQQTQLKQFQLSNSKKKQTARCKTRVDEFDLRIQLITEHFISESLNPPCLSFLADSETEQYEKTTGCPEQPLASEN